MSYIVTIRRSSEPSISRKELLVRVSELADLELEVDRLSDDSNLVFHWTADPSGRPFGLVFHDGSIDTMKTPSHAVLRRLQALARELDARVFGEEGEDLTDAEAPDLPFDTNSSGGCCGCLLVMLGLTALAAWLIV